MRSKQKRLQEVAENRRAFNSFRRFIRANFDKNNLKFRRDSSLYEAEECEIEARDLESGKRCYLTMGDNVSADYLNIPLIETYKQSAVCYQEAGIYSVLLSDPKKAFKCFRMSAKNYKTLSEMLKDESFSISPHMLHESIIAKRNAEVARHESAYRKVRLLRLSLGLIGRK